LLLLLFFSWLLRLFHLLLPLLIAFAFAFVCFAANFVDCCYSLPLCLSLSSYITRSTHRYCCCCCYRICGNTLFIFICLFYSLFMQIAIKIAFIFTFLPASFGFKAIEIDSDWSKWLGVKIVGREKEGGEEGEGGGRRRLLPSTWVVHFSCVARKKINKLPQWFYFLLLLFLFLIFYCTYFLSLSLSIYLSLSSSLSVFLISCTRAFI